MPKKALLFPLMLTIAFTLFAQESEENEEAPIIKLRQDFWFGPSGDFALYSASGNAFGGGLQMGFGSGTSLGFKLSWFFSPENIDTIELNLIFRFYLLSFSKQRSNVYSGPFIQIYSGPSIYFQNSNFELPSGAGMFSIGGGFGWRFIVFRHIYIEPFVRGGYPYQFGAGVSLGVRF